MGASLKYLSWSAAGRHASAARTVVHLIVGPARDERCVVLSLSCGARPRPGYPQHYCTLRMPVARPACTPCLGWVQPFRGANPGSQLVAVVTEVPGFGVADVRACRSGERVNETYKRSRFRRFRVLWLACW